MAILIHIKQVLAPVTSHRTTSYSVACTNTSTTIRAVQCMADLPFDRNICTLPHVSMACNRSQPSSHPLDHPQYLASPTHITHHTTGNKQHDNTTPLAATGHIVELNNTECLYVVKLRATPEQQEFTASSTVDDGLIH